MQSLERHFTLSGREDGRGYEVYGLWSIETDIMHAVYKIYLFKFIKGNVYVEQFKASLGKIRSV